MSELWQTEPLGKHCYIKARIGWRGLSASEYTKSGPYLVAGKHIENGVIDWEHCDHISESRYRESWEIALADGDVILTKDGTIGRVARVDRLPGKATINGTMMLVRPMSEIDYRFLYHVLNGSGFKKLIDDKISGSSIPHIFQRDMVTLPVSFPPTEHQRALADVLDTLDTAIREGGATIAKLKLIKQGLLHDLLTRGIDENGEVRPPTSEAPHLYKESPRGWIPKAWDLLQLGKIAALQRGHDIVETAFSPGPYPVISSSGIVGYHDVSTSRGPNVVVGRKGSIGTVHYVETDFWAHDTSLFVTNFFGNDERFICHLFTHLRLGQYGTKSGSPSLNRNDVHPLWVGRPNLPEQKMIVRALAAHDGTIRGAVEELQKLKKLKLSLMDDLLTGRVRVTRLVTTKK